MCLIYLTCEAYFKEELKTIDRRNSIRIRCNQKKWDEINCIIEQTCVCQSYEIVIHKLSNQDYKIGIDIDSMSSEDILWSLERNNSLVLLDKNFFYYLFITMKFFFFQKQFMSRLDRIAIDAYKICVEEKKRNKLMNLFWPSNRLYFQLRNRDVEITHEMILHWL
jgi:hypothetical protein